MKKSKLFFLLAATAAAVPAMALTVNETSGIVPSNFNPANNPPILPGGAGILANSPSINLPIDTFNTALGTLTGVSYTLTYHSYATYNLSNTGGSPAVFEITWRVGRNTGATDLNTLAIPGNGSQTSFSALHSAFVIVPASSNASGPTMYDTDTTSAGSPLGNLAPFLGNGVTQVNFVFVPIGFSSVSLEQQAAAQPTPNVFVAARVDVVYTYTNQVPEPSTYAAGAVVLAGAGLILRRRMVAGKLN